MKITASPKVLYYHIVADNLPEIYPQGINVSSFFAQIRAFQQKGYNFHSLSDVLENPHNFNGKDLAISFDDGFAATYPILIYLCKEYKIKPTLFLIGKCIDNREMAWNHKFILLKQYCPPEKLAALIDDYIPGATTASFFSSISMANKDEITDALWRKIMPFSEYDYLKKYKPFLSRSQLESLLDAGVELGIHSWSHPDFSRLNYAEAYNELQRCFSLMEEVNILFHRYFAYPYGRPAAINIESKLIKELPLSATFGISYKPGDNLSANRRWQRIKMDGSKIVNWEQFYISPFLRLLKHPIGALNDVF